MKKIVSGIIVFAVVLSLFACAPKDNRSQMEKDYDTLKGKITDALN